MRWVAAVALSVSKNSGAWPQSKKARCTPGRMASIDSELIEGAVYAGLSPEEQDRLEKTAPG